jgi:ribonucleoside-diphosphate reductase alpha chain
MIKIIIKRDGSTEPFNAQKVNGWGEWAADNLGHGVDWTSAVLYAVSVLPEECPSEDLQEVLIQYCLDKHTWEYNLMAGRLYAALLRKTIHGGDEYPSVMEVHTKLLDAGLMTYLNYSKEDYKQANRIIKHGRNYTRAHFELHQTRHKYSLRDKVRNIEFETAQFVYMRMAMALAENEPRESRMLEVEEYYEGFSNSKINPPTPYSVNLGTGHNGYASCCVWAAGDTWNSLAAGDHISYAMTVMSAGIGGHIKSRSIGDPIRGGLIEHQGKLPYYRAQVGAIGANLQNGRGGAETMHYTAHDPEVFVIQKLKNAMTPAAKQVRGMDYSFGFTKFVARLAAQNKEMALFSYYDAPDLYEAQYAKDEKLFEKLYAEFLASDKPRTMVNARQVVLGALVEGQETGRHYLTNLTALNQHTPFLEPIYSSNLCQEIALPTKPFNSVQDLYRNYKEGDGEIALCNLAGILVANIHSDEEYADAAYRALKMIDEGIHKSDYPFPALADTAKARMSAGVGIIGLAHLMALKGLSYDSQEGLNFIHELAETHYWHLLNASLRLGQERGNAPWMHKTKWPQGWLPIDTYEKRVDSLVTVGNKRDWESLRAKIIANGGIRNSVLVAHMPGESSSIASGSTNGIYPIRDFWLNKTNDTLSIDYVVPGSTDLRDKYDIVWDIPPTSMVRMYAVVQKFADQTTSADIYHKLQGDATIGTKEMLDIFFEMVKYGMKSRYYVNNLTSKNKTAVNEANFADFEELEADCEGCKL